MMIKTIIEFKLAKVGAKPLKLKKKRESDTNRNVKKALKFLPTVFCCLLLYDMKTK